MLIQRLTVIGVGLIGGSLARALKQANQCAEIVGCGRNVENLEQAIELNVIDRYETNPAIAVQGADVVVVAVPLGTIAKTFNAIQPVLQPQTIITDVGSAKGCVVADARQHLGTHLPYFVPGHPIAGSEKTGVVASKVDLFVKRRVILTPLAETDQHAYVIIREMWQATGAEVVEMAIDHHDKVLAATSHLPHLLAYSLVDTLAQMESQSEIFRFAAGGFRDFTRIAASDPQMWHDICLANKDALLEVLQLFNQDLQQLTQAIAENNSPVVMDMFKRAKAARDKFTG